MSKQPSIFESDPRWWYGDRLKKHFAGWTDDQLRERYDYLCKNSPPDTGEPAGQRRTGPAWEAWEKEVCPIGKEIVRRLDAVRWGSKK